MAAEDRLRNSLAQRLYDAHCDWQSDLSPGMIFVRWWAMRDDIKDVYREAADALIKAESRNG